MIRILLVEDVSTDAELIKRALIQGKILFNLLTVETRKDYTDALSSFAPDVILSDHTLPSFNSHEALDILHSAGLKIPFILITGNISEEFSLGVVDRGADDYILKDRLERLPTAVINSLEKFRLERERLQYLEDLKRSEQRSRALIENIADVISIIDVQGSIKYYSPAMASVLGYSDSTAIINLFDIIHPDDRATLISLFRSPGTGQEIPRTVQAVKLRHQDDSWKFVDGTITNMCSEPLIEGFIFTFRDVTARIESEEIRRESENQYRALFENSMDAILLTEQNGRILAANTGACQLFQMTEEEICSGGRESLVDLDDPRLPAFLNKRALEKKVRGELTLRRKDGTKFPGEISSRVYTTAHDTERTSMVIRDISERKLAELELRENEEKYRQLFQSSPVPKWIFVLGSLVIVDVNQTAIDLYGYSREEFLNLTLRDLRLPNEHDRLEKSVAEAEGNDGTTSVGMVTHKRKDGTFLKVEVSCYRLKFHGQDCMLTAAMDVTEREATLEKLLLNEKRLLSAQKIASLGYWQLDLADNSPYWSDEVYSIWGFPKDELTLTLDALVETIHPNDRDEFLGRHTASINEGCEFDMEYRLLLPNGEVKWVYDKGEIIRDEQGGAIFLEGTVQDITAKRQATQNLAISEARHRGIVNSQSSYLVRTDLEGNYSYINGSFLRDFDWMYPDGDVIGKNPMASIMPYHHEIVFETVTKCLSAPNEVFQIEIDKPKKDGGVRTTLWDFVCLIGVDGAPQEIQCAGIDITARISAEAALKESLTRYDYVAKATSDAIWDWDLLTDSVYWSEAIVTVFKHDSATLSTTSRFWTDHIHPDDVGRIHEGIRLFILGEESRWEEEYRFQKANGHYAYVRDQGFMIRDISGKAIRMVGSMADITESKRSEIQLRELNEQLKSFMSELIMTNRGLEQFSYIVSHNLRAPVANIIGLAELAGGKGITDDEKATLLPELVTAARRLDEVIGDLNLILQIKGKVNEHNIKLSLSDVISSVKLDLQNKIEESNAVLIVDLKHGDEICSIRSYVYSIFYNMISNSIKYSRPNEPPRISIVSKIVSGAVVISFSDNGLGIDLRKKGEQLFGLYKRFHHHVEGKGMGLFMVKTQAEALGGKISVDSEVGKGTTFTVELPAFDIKTELEKST
jgi:PAS domain S-box-containing protein